MVGLGILGVFSLGAAAVTVAVLVFFAATWLDRPLPVFGFDEGPDQPIAFPHTVHVQEMGLDCTFCHRNVTKGEAATIPAVNLCMSCHVAVGEDLPEVEKLRDIHERGEPIDWVRVHRVPDHVQFVHEAHVRRFSGTKTVVEQVRDVETEIRRVRSREDRSQCQGRRHDGDHVLADLLHLPRRRRKHDEGQAGAVAQDGRLRRLPPQEQRARRLHDVPLLG